MYREILQLFRASGEFLDSTNARQSSSARPRAHRLVVRAAIPARDAALVAAAHTDRLGEGVVAQPANIRRARRAGPRVPRRSRRRRRRRRGARRSRRRRPCSPRRRRRRGEVRGHGHQHGRRRARRRRRRRWRRPQENRHALRVVRLRGKRPRRVSRRRRRERVGGRQRRVDDVRHPVGAAQITEHDHGGAGPEPEPAEG